MSEKKTKDNFWWALVLVIYVIMFSGWLSGCAQTAQFLWTKSNTLPIGYTVGIELKGEVTETEKEELRASYYKQYDRLLGISNLARNEFNETLDSEGNRVNPENVRFCHEHDLDATFEPGKREYLFVFRFVRIKTDFVQEEGRHLMLATVYLSEVTSTPADVMNFPLTFKKKLLEDIKLCGETKARSLGLLSSH